MSGPSAGDEIVPGSNIIETRVAELRQLFSAIDPSPFHERDLDPRAEEFIVGWAEDLPRDARLALLIHLDRAPGRTDEAAILGEAIHRYFAGQMKRSQRSLRELFHRGRISLLIALVFLVIAFGIGDAVTRVFEGNRVAEILQEGLIIAGWVAMWRPLEVFLYDWWPVRARVRLFQRLSAMPVRIDYRDTSSSAAWRADWPETG